MGDIFCHTILNVTSWSPLFAVEYDLIWCEHMLSKLMLKTKPPRTEKKRSYKTETSNPLWHTVAKKTRFRRSLRWKWWRCRALRKVNWERSLQWKGSCWHCWHMSHLSMPPWIYPPTEDCRTLHVQDRESQATSSPGWGCRSKVSKNADILGDSHKWEPCPLPLK